MTHDLAAHRKCIERGQLNWLAFTARRKARLKQLERQGGGAEKIAENILEDLLTNVLDWPLEDINYQIKHYIFNFIWIRGSNLYRISFL